MKFGPVPSTEAQGHINAHRVDVGTGRIAKGAVITADDVARLSAAGIATITTAQIGPEDLSEDAAATQLAQALVPDPEAVNLRLTSASTGRVNVYATREGIVTFEPAAIHRFNAINPMITVATVPPFHRLAADGMVATIKIIAYAVPAGDVALAAGTGATLSLATGIYRSATLIETRHGAETPSVKGRRALAGRVEPLEVNLTDRVIVPHTAEDLSKAIADAPGDVIFVLTGSATSDIADVAPTALRWAGGAVSRFGMPVDPGNLLFLGDLGAKPVIGLPGCARSPALNGADWVINRILCGVPVRDGDIAMMGVGGLLKEIPTRPRPRAG